MFNTCVGPWVNSLQLGECMTLRAVLALRLWCQAARDRATHNLPMCRRQLPAKKIRRTDGLNHHWWCTEYGQTMNGRMMTDDQFNIACRGLSIDCDIEPFYTIYFVEKVKAWWLSCRDKCYLGMENYIFILLQKRTVCLKIFVVK